MKRGSPGVNSELGGGKSQMMRQTQRQTGKKAAMAFTRRKR